MFKFSPSTIVKNHVETLRDARTDKTSFKDIVSFYVFPFILAGIISPFSDTIYSNQLLTPVLIMGVIATIVLIQSFKNGLELRRDTIASNDSHAITLADETVHNCLYAVTVTIVFSFFLMIVGVLSISGIFSIIVNIIIIATFAHIVLTMLMVLKRIGSMYRAMFP